VRNDVLRSNISQNDGSSGQPSLFVYGGEVMTGIQVVSNHVSSARGAGPLVELIGCVSCHGLTLGAADYPHGRPYTDVRFRGNTFTSSRGKPLLMVNQGSATKLVFQGDSWRSIGGRFLVTFGGHRLLTPAAWRAVTPNDTPAQQ
jgi:hypothetical protein